VSVMWMVDVVCCDEEEDEVWWNGGVLTHPTDPVASSALPFLPEVV
jgi:hypothetical protein